MNKQTTIKQIPIDKIDNTGRTRYRYEDEKEWEDFKKNIANNGLISAISVKDNQDGTYKLLAGGHRLSAVTELGWETVNATIYLGEISDIDMKLIELSENIKRKNLSPLEEALQKEQYYNLMIEKYGEKRSKSDKDGVSMRDIADMLGESKSNFSRDLALARASRVMPELADAKTKSEASKIANTKISNLHKFKKLQEIKKETGDDITSGLIEMADRYFRVGDFFEGIKDAVDENVDFVHIDPPYAIDLTDVKKQSLKEHSSITDYNEIEQSNYKDFMQNVLVETYRVAKKNSFAVLWLGIQHYQLMFDAATEAGWLVSPVPSVWIKPAGQTNNPRFVLATATEFFLVLRKGTPEIKKQGRTNIFDFKPLEPSKKIHPTEKPIELIQEIYKTFTYEGSRILSPFLGSGVDILAAIKQKSTCYGWDLSGQYKNDFIIKLNEMKEGGI